jgi:glycine hydroxymethyltransferase
MAMIRLTRPLYSPQQMTLQQHDPEIDSLLKQETRRQSETLSLIASENHCSAAVRAACASVITDKYAEGYPGARYYAGCEVADQLEEVARRRALKMFPGAEHVNVQPHSGTTANLAALETLAGPGGAILGMALSAGGHLSHGYPKSHTGEIFAPTQYGVDPETGLIRYDEVRELALKHRPKVLIAGASSYTRSIDYAAMAEIAREVDAYVMADIAHPAGLIAGGQMPSPVGHADVVTMTTHKTLRGPRGGMILSTKELARRVDSSVFPGAQGGPLMHQIAGKAVAFREALQPDFVDYARRVVANARALAACLKDQGLTIVTGGTDNHMVLVDLRATDMTGADVESRGLAAGLSINKNMIPGDTRSPRVTSGIRLGTAAATTRGMGLSEMEALADILVGLIRGKDPASFQGRVREICVAFPPPA